MSTEYRLALQVDVDPLTDRPWVTFEEGPGAERGVFVAVANGEIVLTFASRFEFLGWLNVMARQYEERWGLAPPAAPAEPDAVEELGTPLAFGRGRPPSDPWRVS